jgi:hypothetical protein
MSHYVSAKHGVVGLMPSLAVEPQDITGVTPPRQRRRPA